MKKRNHSNLLFAQKFLTDLYTKKKIVLVHEVKKLFKYPICTKKFIMIYAHKLSFCKISGNVVKSSDLQNPYLVKTPI